MLLFIVVPIDVKTVSSADTFMMCKKAGFEVFL